jgi:uncharacterized RDD family membrane protein YckC
MQDPHDPYLPPESDVHGVARQGDRSAYPQAGAWRRLATYIVDLFVFYALMFVVGVIGALVFGPEAVTSAFAGWKGTAFSLAMLVAYYLAFEGAFARTPGKWAAGTLVIDESGRAPSAKQVLQRTACRLIPFEAFSMLGDGIGWHDTIPKTRVVRVRGVATPSILPA